MEYGEPEIITCENCGTQHKSKFSRCSECGYERFSNVTDGRCCGRYADELPEADYYGG